MGFELEQEQTAPGHVVPLCWRHDLLNALRGLVGKMEGSRRLDRSSDMGQGHVLKMLFIS